MNDLSAARYRLSFRWQAPRPYLASAVADLTSRVLRDAPGVDIAAVDREGRLYLGSRWPQVAADPCAAAAVLAHECWHVLRQHHERLGPQLASAENVAADAAINGADPAGEDGLARAEKLLGEEIVRPGSTLWPAERGKPLPVGLPAEEYLRRMDTPPRSVCGNFKVDLLRPDHPAVQAAAAAGIGGCPPMLRRAIARSVAEAIRFSPGCTAGELEWSEAELAPPRVPWQRELAAVMGRALSGPSPATSWAAIHRRSGSGWLLPGTRHRGPRVAAILDASGSMGAGADSPLRAAAGEVLALLRRHGATVTSWDTQGTWSRSLTSLYGGGGTDMAAACRSAAALRPQPDAVVCVTDGHTPWPAESEMAKSKLIVAIVGDDAEAQAASKEMPWAKIIRVGEGKND